MRMRGLEIPQNVPDESRLGHGNPNAREVEEQQKEREAIPAVEGLVFKDNARPLSSSQYHVYQQAENVPQEIQGLLRPMVLTKKEGNDVIPVKAIRSSARGSFVEHGFSLEGTAYNFLCWKGTGAGEVFRYMQEHGEDRGVSSMMLDNPTVTETPYPIFTAEFGGQTMTRFTCGSYFQNLKQEADQYRKMHTLTNGALRTPPVLATYVFSREFAEQYGLPLPNVENPFVGESPTQYASRIGRDFGFEPGHGLGYQSHFLGENIRAIRNPFRVDDIEQSLKIADEAKRVNQLRAILDTSRNILGREFGIALDYKEYLVRFSELLADQATVLLDSHITHGSMYDHKQDITLAAEIADLDAIYHLDNEYMDRVAPRKHAWVESLPAEDRKGTLRYAEEGLRFQQILKVGSHLQPILRAVKELDRNVSMSDDELADLFVRQLTSSPRWERIKNEFTSFLAQEETREQKWRYFSHEGLVREGAEGTTERNFSGQELYLQKIADAMTTHKEGL